ncbi:zinc dependent phospholipase C family protein [Desulfobacter latus]|uniref:Zinc dependent phospholipase C family protein n=1 Tax=Desulfobacter latus TaxID=2292 RepID=A0A850TAA1_9BACT|nr:zinc dependent phospholipase C family protein [Desulfobacter latus]NWH06522.1 zinc dependent phospholipase C family protein [Desulfobacter latus]
MPKEITHIALAEQVKPVLPETSKFFQPVQTFPLIFLIGAVCPDSPFYYLAGPQKKQVQAMAKPFHRPNKQALLPVLKFLNHHRTPWALALAAGIVCHIMSDSTFHPLVYYYAGMDGMHTGATARHRYFETAMDVHFQYLFRGKTRLYKIIRQANISKRTLYQLMADLFLPHPPNTAFVKHALQWHATLHALFGASVIRKGTIKMAGTPHPVPDSFAGLIYPFSSPCFLPFFSGRLKYRHPCSGAFYVTDLLTLIREVVNATLAVLGTIDRAMEICKINQKRERLESLVLADTALPDICPDLPANTFSRWHGRQDIKPLLYHGVTRPF